VLAFVPSWSDGKPPLDAWHEEERQDRALVRSARVIAEAPPCLWLDGRPLLPLSPSWSPDAGPPGPVVGRAYRVGDGWGWACVRALPRAPDPGVVLRRMTLELWRLRLHDRRVTFEDVLRERSTVVYRACAEAARA
jgi:hypothetical protein